MSLRFLAPSSHAIAALALALLGGPQVQAAKTPAALPDLTKAPPSKTANSYQLGPAGALGWMHVGAGMTETSRQILVTTVENGSPADGKLEPGDVILGVFGKPLTVWRKGKSQTIELKLQVMGTYSETSPYACPKAEKILAQGLAAMLKNFDKENGLHINELALLASGEPGHLDLVRKSAREVAAKTPEVETLWKDSSKGGMKTWHHGNNNCKTI